METAYTKSQLDTLLLRCEDEPLHLSGAIQDFGALLRVKSDSGLITHASVNLERFTGVDADSVIGRPIGSLGWLPGDAFDRLPAAPGKTQIVPFTANATGQRLDARLIRGEDTILIEIEASADGTLTSALQQLQRPLLRVPANEEELTAHHDLLLKAIREISGFDRIMLYRFHEDWSGEVIAEICNAGMGTYLGLRFPASDIPAVARNLYLLNPSRLIADVAAEPVAIHGITAEPPDLTLSDLRSVSPVHLQYLSNMGVATSFSVPIRMAGRLWGLVACHHLSPRTLTTDQRNTCATLAAAHALGLSAFVASQRLQLIDTIDRRIERLLETISRNANPLDGIETHGQTFLDVIAADGFAMVINSDVVIVGDAPDLVGMAVVDQWFLNECSDPLIASNHLEDLFSGQVMLLAAVSGMLAVKSLSPRSGWVRFYWFRNQQPQEVAWAGNPNKPVVEKAGALMLSPRRSFERWVEIKTGYSAAWTNEERITASKFRNSLLNWL
jgi:light-regulated signal transduction histidine kinase (bacteriophytochrome)